MSSILPVYNYDIFISYRQKDNKYDGWVTEFVENLRKELEATFKEDLSIYFDNNPHDGLLETDNIDASLKEKLKCLIFIPIISQTYCDSRSFAWQHEFISFNKSAREDDFGRDVRLRNGNISSRILPVKIHEIDADDKELLENELGSTLRSIEFIFRSHGVNRPLRSNEDHPNDNLNKTYYRDQINKVANSIKEVITALRFPGKSENKVSGSSFALNGIELALKEKRIAILPFTDLSAGHDQEYLGDGMAAELISLLSNLSELTVTGRTSSFSFKNKNLDLKTIGDLLNVKTILEGSIQKSGNRVRITVQLINTSDGNHVWSQRYDREMSDIFELQDDICSKIVEHLKITLLEEFLPASEKRTAINPLAYEMYLKGDYYDKKYTRDGFEKAIEYFKKAIEIEPDYSDAWWFLGLANFELNGFFLGPAQRPDDKLVMFCADKSMSIDPSKPYPYLLKALVHFNCDYNWAKTEAELEKGNQRIKTPFPLYFTPMEPWIRAMLYGDFDFAIKRMQLAITYDPLNQFYQFHLAHILLYVVRDFRKSISVLNNLMELGYPEESILRPLCLSYLYEKEYVLAEKYARKEYEFSKAKGHGAANLIICQAALGKKTAALNLYKEVCDRLTLSEFPELLHVKANAALGNIDVAFEYLDKAITEKNYWLFTLKYSPEWDQLRSDPRFKLALIRMRFPE